MIIAVKRDGETLSLFESENDAAHWLLRHQGQSIHHATTHEGYSIDKLTALADVCDVPGGVTSCRVCRRPQR